MLRSTSEFKDFSIAATDGDIGQVEAFCFDEEQWAVRYVVVNIGGWLRPRKVLIAPASLGAVDLNARAIATELTRQEVRASPRSNAQPVENSRLRSTRELGGFNLDTRDGDIGHIEDFILDDQSWMIRYLVIATRNWLPGKKVTIPPRWIRHIDWQKRKAKVELSFREIIKSPEYDDTSLIDRAYEERLHEHYRQTGYWSG